MDAGLQLSDARTRAGLTTRQLAVRARTSHSTISAYEKGVKSPSVSTFLRLINACGFELEQTLRPVAPFDDRRLRGRELREVLDLADALPQGGKPALRARFPGR
jgi:transcriptional regulator with XRE-family HTH domain